LGRENTVARSATILLVEDDPSDALLVRKAAQKTLAGIPIALATDGEEAVRYLKGEGQYSDRSAFPFPDLVLLDLKMPRMNGYEFLRWIRAQPVLKRLPVIVLTGSIQETDTRRAYEEGANSYVTKPSNFDDLVEAMKTLGDFWLSGSKLPEATPPGP
jgi:CheY-like chemotaxis protein